MSATLLLAVPTSAFGAEAPLGIRINEVVSNGGSPDDWIEFYNSSDSDVDLSSYVVQDNSDKNPYAFPAGTIVASGEYLVIDTLSDTGEGDFDFGLGKGDSVRLFAADAAEGADPLLQTSWPDDTHAVPSWGVQDVDGEPVWSITNSSTKGAANTFAEVLPEEPVEPEEPVAGSVFINEVDSQPADWVEFYNPGGEAFDLSGYEIRDNSDDHRWQFAPGASLEAGGFLVVEEGTIGIVDGVETAFRDPIGIGSADSIRLFDTSGALVDDTEAWDGHAAIDGDFVAATLARCVDGKGAFSLATPTPGAPNACVTPGDGGGDGGGDDGGGDGELELAPWPGSADVRVLDASPTFLEDSSGLDIQESADGTFLWAVDNGEGRIWKLKASADGSLSMVDGWADGKRVRFQKDADAPGAAGPDTEGITTDANGLVYVASERDNSAKGVNENKILQVDPNGAGPDLVALTEWDLTAQLPAVGANLGIEAVEWVSDAALTGTLFDDDAQSAYDPARYAGKNAGLFFVAVEDNGGVYAFALSADGSTALVSTIDPGLAGVMALDYDTVLGALWAVCDDGCHGASAQITLNGTAEPGIVRFARAAGLPDVNNEGFATAPASLASNGQRPVWWFADGFASEALHTGTLAAAAGGGDGPGDGSGDGSGGGSGDGDGDGEGDGSGSGGGGSQPGSGASPSAGADKDVLATTGSELPVGALALALGLLIAGAIEVILRRRRQAA